MEISATPLGFLRNRVKLRHLRLILILEEERSVTRAAERLCISPAAVSKTRTEIEAEIGAPLFERINNRLEVTELGRSVLQAAKRILAELDSLSEEVSLMRSGMRGTLAIGIRSISAEPFMARVTSAFKAAHPDLTIRLIDGDLTSLLERLGKGDISLLVGRFDEEHARSGLESHAILADPHVVVASPDHPIARKAKIEWAELVAQRWCLIPAGFAGRLSREHLSTHLTRLNLPFPRDVVETNSSLMILTLLQSADYLSIMPLGVAYNLARRRVARLVKVPPLGPVDPVCLMWRADMALPPAARRFREFAIDMLAADASAGETGRKKGGDPIAERRFGMVGRAGEWDPRSLGKLYRAAERSSKRLPSA